MKSSFQTILMIVFIAAFVIAVAVFAGLFGNGAGRNTAELQGTVVVWGVYPQETMSQYVDGFNALNKGYVVEYQEMQGATLERDLVTSIANGMPPDILLFPTELYGQIAERLYEIPYAALPERTFRDTYIDGAQLYLGAQGISAVPVVVDPIVMYYNKDMLAAARFVVPPTTWPEFVRAVPIFTSRNQVGGINQSTIGLGTSTNVQHMRDILSALFLQTGNSIMTYDITANSFRSTLGTSTGDVAGDQLSPAAQVLSFYTSFADPTNVNYSWNSSLPGSLESFVSGNSVFYFGRASDLFAIQARNPNLNFDVVNIPQPDSRVRPVTYGSFVAAGIAKNSTNFAAAYDYFTAVTSREGVDELSKRLSLPPTRRDLLLVQQANPYVSIFFNAALSTFSWADPNPATTDIVFRNMINSINSGRTDATSALYEASRSLQSNANAY